MKRLTEKEILDNWFSSAMFVVLEDGSDSLLQDNGYSLDDALAFCRQGLEIYFD